MDKVLLLSSTGSIIQATEDLRPPFSAGFQIVTHPIGPLDELAFKHPAAEIMDLITGLVTGPGSYRDLFAEWVARFQFPPGGYCLPYYV